MSLIELAEQEARERGVQVTGLHVKVGAMCGVVSEALRASFEMACADTSLRGTRLVIDEIPVVVHCMHCGLDRQVEGVALECPVCAMPAFHIVAGKELQLEALEVEE